MTLPSFLELTLVLLGLISIGWTVYRTEQRVSAMESRLDASDAGFRAVLRSTEQFHQEKA